jgi:hypothetical protein
VSPAVDAHPPTIEVGRSVVLAADSLFVVPQINPAPLDSPFVDNGQLRPRCRQATVVQHQPKMGLLLALRKRRREPNELPSLAYASKARVPAELHREILGRAGAAAKGGIQHAERIRPRERSRQVDGASRRCQTGQTEQVNHAVHRQHRLMCHDALTPRDHYARRHRNMHRTAHRHTESVERGRGVVRYHGIGRQNEQSRPDQVEQIELRIEGVRVAKERPSRPLATAQRRRDGVIAAFRSSP